MLIAPYFSFEVESEKQNRTTNKMDKNKEIIKKKLATRRFLFISNNTEV